MGGELVSPGCHISTRRIPKQITRREHARRPSQARDTGILGIARAIEGLFLTKTTAQASQLRAASRHTRPDTLATVPMQPHQQEKQTRQTCISRC